MKKWIQDFTVIENITLNSEYFELIVSPSDPLPEVLPGQFAAIRVDHSPGTFLRRPISIYDTDYQKNTLSFLIQVVGEGTKKLSGLRKSDTLNLIYPLGNTFDTAGVRKPLLIGGGIGIAPLLFLGNHLKDKGLKPVFILGFRHAGLLVDLSPFRKYGEVYLTTDDGSAGERGLVLDHSILRRHKFDFDMIYTCGPEVMMKAVAEFALDRGIQSQVSLENTMACGFGACLCCVQKTRQGNKIVCTEGPVFNSRELVWQI
ncbi:MAG: dihydroorotate dehydrogenase electron transfer subunit [Bacteroidales bacterium]|nr:MAG: dihydroorotate dehydrogenase electron transfer subunit [Bacteroidales bacterium]